MNVFDVVVLGVIQGVTEFLPISSSGHLAIAQHYLGLTDDLLFFDVLLHAATLMAVLLYFGPRLASLTRKLWKFVLVASIPAIVAGLFLEPLVEKAFATLSMVAVGLLITAILLVLSTRLRLGGMEEKTKLHPWWVGLFQAMAIMPGISRSGSTIASGLMVGMSVQDAFDVSFLMSIPVIAGALLLQLKELVSGDVVALDPVWLIGMLTAMLSGIASLKLLRFILGKQRIHWFAGYCAVVAIVILLV